jgi:cell division protein FtsL
MGNGRCKTCAKSLILKQPKEFHTAVYFVVYSKKSIYRYKERKMAAQAKRNKRRKYNSAPPKKGKANFFQRKKTTSEKVFMVVGILIAISMVLSLVVSLGSSAF